MVRRVVAVMAFGLGLSFSGAAWAQAVITFAAKRGEDRFAVPHGYVRISGTTQSGETLSHVLGFMPVEASRRLVWGGRVRGAVVGKPEAEIVWDRVQPFLSIQIADTALDAVLVRFRYWHANQNGGYDVYDQNCITFLADIARTLGLKVPPGSSLSPSGFLRQLAAMNPPGSVAGILAAPVANPSPADLAPEQADTPAPPAEPVTAPN